MRGNARVGSSDGDTYWVSQHEKKQAFSKSYFTVGTLL